MIKEQTEWSSGTCYVRKAIKKLKKVKPLKPPIFGLKFERTHTRGHEFEP
jgi:hypothetical protein